MDWFPTRTRTCYVMHIIATTTIRKGRNNGLTDEEIIKEMIES